MSVSTYAVLSLAELKAFLKISGSTEDTFLEPVIDSISAAIDSYIGRHVVARAITGERHDGDVREEYIKLKHYPVTTMTSIYTGVTDADAGTLLDSALYYVDKQSGFVRSYGGWANGEQNISVNYTAGIAAATASVPANIKLAAAQWIANIRQNISGLKSESMGSYSYTSGDLDKTGIPINVALILDGYRS